MHIGIITPATAKSLNGNRATAKRWAGFLRQLGHKVCICVHWDEAAYDLMIALHAWRSANAITAFKTQYPSRPLIVAMTGTDLYHFINTHPETTLRSIELADYLVTLHGLASRALPPHVRNKTYVIYQSAIPLTQPPKPSVRYFDVCIAGHLREEKDAMRAAYAARKLPPDSRIRILHYGKAHNDEWAAYAMQEMKINPRYHWYGEIPHWKLRQVYRHCHVMVLSSVMEGGANVISEACVAGLPVIASDIDGSVGLLGEDYAGYYPLRDTAALRTLLLKAESNPDYLSTLKMQCQQRANLFTPEAERQRWKNLLKEVMPPSGTC